MHNYWYTCCETCSLTSVGHVRRVTAPQPQATLKLHVLGWQGSTWLVGHVAGRAIGWQGGWVVGHVATRGSRETAVSLTFQLMLTLYNSKLTLNPPAFSYSTHNLLLLAQRFVQQPTLKMSAKGVSLTQCLYLHKRFSNTCGHTKTTHGHARATGDVLRRCSTEKALWLIKTYLLFNNIRAAQKHVPSLLNRNPTLLLK